jgi:hypothetical protein
MISASHGSAQEMCKQESDPFGSCAAEGDWESTRFFPLAGDGLVPILRRFLRQNATRYQEDRSSAKAQERAEPEVRIHLPPAGSHVRT